MEEINVAGYEEKQANTLEKSSNWVITEASCGGRTGY